MLSYIAQRAALAIAVAFTVSLAAFMLLNIATDPAYAIAGEDADPEVIEQIRQRFGLDRPPFGCATEDWLAGVLRGDFGVSYYWNKPVATLVTERVGTTLTLAFSALMVTIAIAIPLGALAALNRNTWIDRFALWLAVSAQAVPNFWLGLILIILFAVMLPIFPVFGRSHLATFRVARLRFWGRRRFRR